MGVLEAHNDGERDGLALARLSSSRGNGNAGDDGLRVERGVAWGRNIWRHGYARVTGQGSVRIVDSWRARILEEKEKNDTFQSNPDALNRMTG